MDRIKYYGLLVIITFSFESCAYFNTVYNAKSSYDEGYEVYLENQRQGLQGGGMLSESFRNAITKGQKILSNFENSRYVDDAYLIIGKSYYYMRQYNQARDYLNLLINGYPDSPLIKEARLYLGRSYIEIEKYVLARQEFNAVLDSNPNSAMKVQVYLALAELNELESDTEGLLYAINQVIQLSKDDEIKANAALETARWAMENDQFARAEVYYKQARQFTRIPRLDRRIDFEVTQLYRRMGEYDLARNEISVMLANEEFEELWPDLEVERGLLYEILGDTARAVEAFQYVTTNSNRTPAGARAHYLLGEISYQNMDYSDARESFRQVSRSDLESMYVGSARERIQVIDRLETVRDKRSKIEKEFTDLFTAYQEASLNSSGSTPQTADQMSKASTSSVQTSGESLPAGLMSWIAQTDTLTKKSEYTEILYQEAELYIFDVHQPGRGLELLDNIITIASDNEMLGKTYLLKIYAYENVLGRPDSASTLRTELEQNFPETLAARALYAKEGDTMDSFRVFSSEYLTAKELYQHADSLIAAEQYQQVLPVLRQLTHQFQDTDFGAKALYTKGWLWENSLLDVDSALVAYEQFQERYPENSQSEKVAGRIKQLRNIQNYLVQGSETPDQPAAEEQSPEPQQNILNRERDAELIQKEPPQDQNQESEPPRQLPELR